MFKFVCRLSFLVHSSDSTLVYVTALFAGGLRYQLEPPHLL